MRSLILSLFQTLKIAIPGLLIAGLVGWFLPEMVSPYVYSIVIYAGINVIMATSLNLIIGLAGQFSMGHAGFMAIGAYGAAFLSLNLQGFVTSWPLAPVISQNLLFFFSLFGGGLLAAVLGYVVGLPSLRLKGDYLAIVTLGFGEIIRVLILNIETIGGARGLPGIPAYTNFTWVYGIAFLSLLAIRRIMHSTHGRALLALREDEIAAEAMGVNTTRYKVTAFVLSSFLAGVGGGLFGHYLTYINPSTFDFNKSFEFIIMVVLGGMGSMSGAVMAALFLTAIRELLRPLQQITLVDMRMILFSIMLITLMLVRPNGFFGRKELTDYGFFRRLRRSHDPSSL